jgi:protocatechuate 3,4-dioxygenase beta subunit
MTLALAGGAILRPAAGIVAAEPKLAPTPLNVLGPFYPMIKPLEKDADLTVIGKKRRAAGKIVHLMGRVFNLRGEPIKGAKIELWQANTHGRYDHPSDQNPAPLDPNFQGYSVQETDKEGRYRFKTIKPGAYPVDANWMRPPHIHFDVSSQKSRLVTQMFFPGEPLNEKDSLFTIMGQDAPRAIGAVFPPGKDMEPRTRCSCSGISF